MTKLKDFMMIVWWVAFAIIMTIVAVAYFAVMIAIYLVSLPFLTLIAIFGPRTRKDVEK